MAKTIRILLGKPVPSTSAGVYIVRSGKCISHIGSSGNLRNRMYKLSRLREHRGSAEVLCAAFCTQEAPEVELIPMPSSKVSKTRETELKSRYGEPPVPERFNECKNGGKLRRALLAAAGPDTYEAGYIDAIFDVGEDFRLLFTKRFDDIWSKVGKPPGPWRD